MRKASVSYTFLLFPKKEAFIYERTAELYRRNLLQAVLLVDTIALIGILIAGITKLIKSV